MKNTAEAQYLLDILRRNGVIELRCLRDGSVHNGLFDDYASAKQAIVIAEKHKMDSYILLNPCYGTATNKLEKALQGSGIKDKDIRGVWCIPMDFDPVRETGTAATDDECKEASDRAESCSLFLKKRGFHEPVTGFSGNGYHLLYFCEMPNDEKTKKTLHDLYLGLKLRFSDDSIKFDTTVRNPSRIFRLYGTTNQKSGRKSFVLFNESAKLIDTATIEALAQEVAPPAPAKPTYVERKAYAETGLSIRGWDIIKAFRSIGLYKRPLGSDKHAVICPWVNQHSSQDHLQKTDTVIWDKNSSGYPGWFCAHDSCAGRGLKDVFNFLVGGGHAAA